MNFKALFPLCIIMLFFAGCDKSVETTFGKKCEKIGFNSEKIRFKSEYDGSFRFQMEEDIDKNWGSLMIGSFAEVKEGSNDLFIQREKTDDNHTNTIYLFSREDGKEEEYFSADSGKIEVEYLYYSSKGNIDFMKGYFYRLVFFNSSGECKVIDRIDFAFY